ncbi:prostaglandin reductase-3-like [Oscarella lobularis]|uniref:prostaglandin reductase-3-like n=1 Tax=Oscarella lobularis TaxID=121494 RepID=UPI003313B11A
MSLPSSFRKIVVNQLTTDFRKATSIVTKPLPKPNAHQLLIKNRYVGINASDINWTAGRYFPVKSLPIDIGFEAVGEIAAVGSSCEGFAPGSPVAYMGGAAFGEYCILPAKQVIPLPDLRPEYVPLLVSGLTASIALEKVGEIKSGETVLVTAAAGGTGNLAVQLAKLQGCHVIGTCSSNKKVEFLKSIGCDRVINYKEEDTNKILKENYPRGIDVVYESCGGDLFEISLNRLAVHGRLIVIGFINHYSAQDGFKAMRTSPIPAKILNKSASVRGFFLNNFIPLWREHGTKLAGLILGGELKSCVDLGEKSPVGPFRGLESIPDAVDYLYSRKSVGKIVVDLQNTTSSKL